MKEWESRLRSCVRTRVQLFGQDIKLVRVTLVSAGTQSSDRLLENKWKNTITSPNTEVLASNKGGPITTTMAARVQNDSTNRSLNTRANWIKKQVEERKKTQLAGESLRKQQHNSTWQQRRKGRRLANKHNSYTWCFLKGFSSPAAQVWTRSKLLYHRLLRASCRFD